MKKLLNLNTVYIAAGIVAVGFLFVPPVVNLYNLKTQGINYFTNDIEKYHNNAHPIKGEYTIEINLNDLESNKGKVLFDDGENQIHVLKVIAHGKNEFELLFRSSGNVNPGGATMVSGVEHNHNKDGLIRKFQATAKATYQGDTYTLNPSKYSGLKYNDGDEFGFYLELPNDMIPDSENKGKVDMTVTDLYLNLWSKKSS